ncbi:MAG: YceH family protein [Caldimonas sp.]
MSLRPLSVLEARALGVLVEKALTVPDSYPLSINALTLGCNQKTARDPVIAATDGEVQVAVDGLKGLSLAFESSGSRVSRYEHNMGRALGLPSQSVALLAALMLRGPQTASELRMNSERLHRFADLSSVEGFLEELATRAVEKGGPLALKMPRLPGAREARWVHLLSGMPEMGAGASASGASGASADAAFLPVTELAALKADHAALRAELGDLRALVDRLYAELGVDRA